MKKLLSLVLSITLLVCCMFSVNAGNELVLEKSFYCGFEDYRAQLTGNSATDAFVNVCYKTDVAEIIEENGQTVMKVTLPQNGLTAFEVRNNASFELEKEAYTVSLTYKTNAHTEISFGMAKAGNVPDTAYALGTVTVEACEDWQTKAINFIADKNFDEGYVPAVIVYAQNGAEVLFDAVTITAQNGSAYVNMPEVNFNSEWYPTFKTQGSTETEETIEIWDGSVAETFAQGSGTETDPYVITNGAELALAITKSGTVQVTNAETGETTFEQEEYYGSYYKIANDIYLNSADAIDWANATGSQKGLTPWFNYYSYKTTTTGENFAGVIDGGNHIIYGLYYYGSGTQNYRNHNISTGFIPKTDSDFSVKISNLGIDSAYFRHQYCAAAFVGSCGNEVAIENCFVGQNVGLSSVSVGAFVGTANQKKVTISNCYSLAKLNIPTTASELRYGMVGFATQSKPLVIRNSYAVGSPLTSNTTTNTNTKYEFYNSYSTEENGTSTGTTSILENVAVIENTSNMQGLDALTNEQKMHFLDSAYYTATEGYPVLSSFVKASDPETGAEIDIWDGTVAEKFAKGSGTSEDPYIISNGAELALAVSSGGGNELYYELSADIYLNDLNKINWHTGDVLKAYKNNNLNTWYGSTTAFAGNINGNGHTVYGIYRNEANAVKGFNTNYKWGTGLFPTVAAGNSLNVTNLFVDYVYIYAECNASVFVGFASNDATLNYNKVGVGENVFIQGGRTGIFHAYAYSGSTVNINVNSCYSLAELDCGFIGLPARTSTSIKNSFAANGTIVAGALKNTVSLENCYQSVEGNYTEGVTNITVDNMKGTDVLTNTSKMPALGSEFEVKTRTFNEAEYIVFLPKGSIINNSEIKTFYDNMCSQITEGTALVNNVAVKDIYVQFADLSNTGEILIPAEFSSLFHHGSRSDIIKEGYYYEGFYERISKKVDTFGDKTVNYIFITDLHYEGNDKQDSSVQERAAMLKEAELVVNWANNDDSIDFVVLGGDLIDGNNKKETSLQYLNEILTPFRSCTKPVLAVPGNHDDNTYSGTFSIERVISDKDWNDNVIDYIVNKDGDIAVQDSKDANSKHFYYDLESKKTRVICLDSCDYYNEYDENGNVTYLDIRDESLGENKHDRYWTSANYRGYSDRQLRWLVEEGLTADEGWDYVFISHQGIDDNTNSKYTVRNGDVLRGIIAAFQNKTAYSNQEFGINVDYSDNTAKILSYQFGHTHTELALYEDDIKLWQINTESSNYDEVGADRAPGRPTAWNPNLNWLANRHEASTESEAGFDVMSVCRDFVYKQSIGIGITEKLYYPQNNIEGDLNGDGQVDILDLVEQNLVLIGENGKKTAADTNKDNTLDSASLRKLILKK